MKRTVFLVALVLASIFFYFSSSSAIVLEEGKETFAGKGSFQRYINFDFIVPQTDCGNLRIYQLKRNVIYAGIYSKWELKKPGQLVKKGFYRFVNSEVECSRSFSLEKISDGYIDQSTWRIIEIEPAEVGLFKENVWLPRNYFNLSTDDKVASYYLLTPKKGTNFSLRTFTRSEDFIPMKGYLYGVIISDSAGFLKSYLTGSNLQAVLDSQWFRDDDVIVLEFRGE